MKTGIHTPLLLIFICISISLFLNIGVSNAQTRKQLEIKRKQLKQEIVKVNSLLFAAKKSEKNALEDLEDLNQKIATRTAYIASIHKEASALSLEIRTNEKEVDKLSKELEVLKRDYAAMIYKSYKSKSKQSQLLFLMSSESFQQAYKRVQYMKQYTTFRKRQGQEITVQATRIQKLNNALVHKREEKETLLLVVETQKEKIEQDKENKEKLVTEIKRKEKKYIREIKVKQGKERKIASQIDQIIRDAIARSNAKIRNKSAKGFALTPEAKALAKRFQLNKGKLPWPVKKGLIVRRFGVQPHPTLGGITISSSGLHIATDTGAIAYSVFSGKVLAIQVLKGGKKAVLIQHGNYITTYNNIETLHVKNGDTVATGQAIGKIFTNKITQKTILIFVVHKETQRQNPANWILKM